MTGIIIEFDLFDGQLSLLQIFRNGEFVGFTSSTAYGFTLQKMVALGFVRHPSTIAGNPTPMDTAWLTDKSAKWSIDVAGDMVPVTAHLHPPNLPIITQVLCGSCDSKCIQWEGGGLH